MLKPSLLALVVAALPLAALAQTSSTPNSMTPQPMSPAAAPSPGVPSTGGFQRPGDTTLPGTPTTPGLGTLPGVNDREDNASTGASRSLDPTRSRGVLGPAPIAPGVIGGGARAEPCSPGSLTNPC